MLRVRRLGLMLRLHRRARWIPDIFKQMRRIARDVNEIYTVVMVDRVSHEVVTTLNRELERKENEILNIELMDAPSEGIVSSNGQKWMESLRVQYGRLRLNAGYPLDAAMLWDDDCLFSEDGLRELRGHLRCLEYDRLDGESIFFWDDKEHINTRFPRHVQASLFRVYPDDDYPKNNDFIVAAPEYVSRSHNWLLLSNPILNHGYMTKADREMVFAAAKLSGRMDDHTLTLVRSPEISEWPLLEETPSQSKSLEGFRKLT